MGEDGGTSGKGGKNNNNVKQEDWAGKAPNKNNPRWKVKFTGKCDELKGHIYDSSDARTAADMFTKTTREIGEYVGRTYRQSGDVVSAMENLAIPIISEPPDPAIGATRTQQRIWEKSCLLYTSPSPRDQRGSRMPSSA